MADTTTAPVVDLSKPTREARAAVEMKKAPKLIKSKTSDTQYVETALGTLYPDANAIAVWSTIKSMTIAEKWVERSKNKLVDKAGEYTGAGYWKVVLVEYTTMADMLNDAKFDKTLEYFSTSYTPTAEEIAQLAEAGGI